MKKYLNKILTPLSIIICLFYLSNASAFHISEKNLKEVQDNPQFILELYKENKNALTQALGESFNNLNDEGLKLIFASLVSYQLKPYGPNPTHAKNLLNALSLSCQEYATLTNQLYKKLSPETPIQINFVGWNDGAVGNHLQIFARFTGEPILVDPTIGLVANTTFDDIISGKPVDIKKIKSFYSRDDINQFNDSVKNSILHGDYKPMDLLFFYSEVQFYPDLTTLIKHCEPAFCDTPQSEKVNALFKNRELYGIYGDKISEMRTIISTHDSSLRLIPWSKKQWHLVNPQSNISYNRNTAIIKTDESISAYQLASKTVHLSPGTYRLLLKEKIVHGAQTISIEKMNCPADKKNAKKILLSFHPALLINNLMER